MPQDPSTVVRTSEKLWSDVVAAADAIHGEDIVLKAFDAAYKFSNGREFLEKNHYGTVPPQP